MVKISEVKGYTVWYSPPYKKFLLLDKDGNEVGSGQTQDEVEQKAKKLTKSTYKFPIPAFKVHYQDRVVKGRITSINPQNRTLYFSYDDKKLGSHEKVHLRWDKNLVKVTDANSRIQEQVEGHRAQIKSIEDQIHALIGQLEEPITPEYFGMEKDKWR